MKEEQINKIRKTLVENPPLGEDTDKLSFLLGARRLRHALYTTNIIDIKNNEAIYNIIEAEIDKDFKDRLDNVKLS